MWLARRLLMLKRARRSTAGRVTCVRRLERRECQVGVATTEAWRWWPDGAGVVVVMVRRNASRDMWSRCCDAELGAVDCWRSGGGVAGGTARGGSLVKRDASVSTLRPLTEPLPHENSCEGRGERKLATHAWSTWRMRRIGCTSSLTRKWNECAVSRGQRQSKGVVASNAFDDASENIIT